MNPDCAPSNRMKFIEMERELRLNELRRELFRHIISSSETDYFVVKEEHRMFVPVVRDELHKLGWKTILTYGDTGLFIFENEKPRNCIESKSLL